MLLLLWINTVSPHGEFKHAHTQHIHACTIHTHLFITLYGVLVFVVGDKQPVTSGRPTSVRVQTLDRYGKPMYVNVCACVYCL